MLPKKKDAHYAVHYRNPEDGKSVTIKARTIADSSLGITFVAISDFIFKSSKLVVNPDEEALMKRFENVKTLHLSIYHIISIEEVGESVDGITFKQDKSNILVMPGAAPTPPTPPKS